MEGWRCDFEGKRKWQAQTNERQWENSTQWNVWKGRSRATRAGAAGSGWKWNTKALWHWANEAGSFRGETPFMGAILVLGCKSLCFPWTLRQPQFHSAPSQLCFNLKVPTWFPGISQTPPISPPRPSCCGMLGRRAVWRWLDCIKNSIQQPCKESHTSPYFRDKETEARWIFKATVLECGEARVESAASVLITCTFPPVLKIIYPYYE